MKWDGQRESDQIEDRRADAGDGGGGRGGIRLPVGRGGRGIGLGTVAVALLASWIFGINPMTVLGLLGGGGSIEAPVTQSAPHTPRAAPKDESARFVATVLASTEDVWGEQFQAKGTAYRKPVLVLFRGTTTTECGRGEAAMGPFYCPADQKVYLDLDFFDVMRQRLGAPGDFAQAYVVAHEVGHHVQRLSGVTEQVERARQRLGEAQSNALSVRVELQADCYAGLWAHHAEQAKRWLDAGDIEEALHAAAQIGDDTLQHNAGGAVAPESFTHGSSEQRVRWFKRGFETGQVAECNTLGSRKL